MVSGQDYYGYYMMGGGGGGGGGGNGSSGVGGVEDGNKKVRKPYTITKCRESWSELEHDKFLEALQLFDRDWKKIEAFIGSKSVIQIRSHAQKYFLKVQKSGAKEHVPPPRPKRKAAHPYPQKAPKVVVSRGTAVPQSSSSLVKLPHVIRSDCLSVPLKSSNPSNSTWTYNPAPAVSMSHVSKENNLVCGPAMTSSSSGDSAPKIWPSGEGSLQRKYNLQKATRVIPDFAQVYSFLGSVFDPDASDHLQKLQKMDPVDVKTVRNFG
ncbi:chromatin/chromatin-binding, or -regulatory protein [Lithospermum erythrorhizon]|uniref:Chromatin/chromatin-binding, or -regulatory protein n=1 Tax=Lithospermum erythrorhizon TaxID=34254 RepID=A0AAV3QWW8_LITER